MTITPKQAEKRPYESDDEEEEGRSGNRYHSCVFGLLQRLFDLANSKLGSTVCHFSIDDTAFVKEIVTAVAQVDGDLLNKEERTKLNNLILSLHGNLDNQTVKRVLRAKNKSLCAIDPSLSKL